MQLDHLAQLEQLVGLDLLDLQEQLDLVVPLVALELLDQLGGLDLRELLVFRDPLAQEDQVDSLAMKVQLEQLEPLEAKALSVHQVTNITKEKYLHETMTKLIQKTNTGTLAIIYPFSYFRFNWCARIHWSSGSYWTQR